MLQVEKQGKYVYVIKPDNVNVVWRLKSNAVQAQLPFKPVGEIIQQTKSVKVTPTIIISDEGDTGMPRLQNPPTEEPSCGKSKTFGELEVPNGKGPVHYKQPLAGFARYGKSVAVVVAEEVPANLELVVESPVKVNAESKSGGFVIPCAIGGYALLGGHIALVNHQIESVSPPEIAPTLGQLAGLTEVYTVHTGTSLASGLTFAESNAQFATGMPIGYPVYLMADPIVDAAFNAVRIDKNSLVGITAKGIVVAGIVGGVILYFGPTLAAAGAGPLITASVLMMMVKVLIDNRDQIGKYAAKVTGQRKSVFGHE